MKTLILTISILSISTIMANELSWVDEQIQAIKPSRVGMSNHDIASLKTPFIFTSKNVQKKDTKNTPTEAGKKTDRVLVKKSTIKRTYKKLQLSLILNNNAMINKNWYHVGDFVAGYKVVQIQRASVLLKNQTDKLLLSTRSKSKKLKFQK